MLGGSLTAAAALLVAPDADARRRRNRGFQRERDNDDCWNNRNCCFGRCSGNI